MRTCTPAHGTHAHQRRLDRQAEEMLQIKQSFTLLQSQQATPELAPHELPDSLTVLYQKLGAEVGGGGDRSQHVAAEVGQQMAADDSLLAPAPHKRGRGRTSPMQTSAGKFKTASEDRDRAQVAMPRFVEKNGSEVRRNRSSQARGASGAPPHVNGEWWREKLLAESRQALDQNDKTLSMLEKAGLLESSHDLTGSAMAAGPRPMNTPPELSRTTSTVVLKHHHAQGSDTPALPTLKSRSRSRRSTS